MSRLLIQLGSLLFDSIESTLQDGIVHVAPRDFKINHRFFG
jgi:hypothetical protein